MISGNSIFRAPFGVHIAQSRRKTPPGLLDFEEVREYINRVLTKMHEHREYLRAIAGLRSRADIRWIAQNETYKQNHEPEASSASS